MPVDEYKMVSANAQHEEVFILTMEKASDYLKRCSKEET